MQFVLACFKLKQNAPSVFPQIHRAGCGGIATVFSRHEFDFRIKLNFLRRLIGLRTCFQQPMNGQNGRRWHSVTTVRRLTISPFIFTSPVLPQIRNWPVRKAHSFPTAIFFDTPMACHGTHDGQGRNKVRFDRFPQGGTSPHLGKYLCGGHQADRRPAVKLSPMKPQLRALSLCRQKNLAYDRREFDSLVAWTFIKK